MQLTPEQVLSAHKAHIEALTDLTRQAFAGVEQLIELNLNLTKTVLAESQHLSLDALNLKDSQQLLASQANLFAPLAHKFVAYQLELAELAKGMGGKASEEVQQQLAQGQVQWEAWLQTASAQAPAGSEPMFNAFRTAMQAGNQVLQGVQHAVEQASSLMHEQLNTLTPTPTASAPAKPRRRQPRGPARG
jgi:phasin family protein